MFYCATLHKVWRASNVVLIFQAFQKSFKNDHGTVCKMTTFDAYKGARKLHQMLDFLMSQKLSIGISYCGMSGCSWIHRKCLVIERRPTFSMAYSGDIFLLYDI